MPTLRTLIAALALLACSRAQSAPPQLLLDLSPGDDPSSRAVNLRPAVEGSEPLAWSCGRGQLVITDGTAANTETLTLLEPTNQQPLVVEQLIILPDRLYLVATTTVSPSRLYTCGRHGGTVTTIGHPDGTLGPAQIVAVLGTQVLFKGNLYFDNGQLADWGLWAADGTPQGTRLLSHTLTPDVAAARIGSKVFLRAAPLNHQYELWETDGTPEGTRMRDLTPGIQTIIHAGPVAIGDSVYFIAISAGSTVAQLWRSNGTDAGTTIVTDLSGPAIRGSSDAFSRNSIAKTGAAFFRMFDVSGPNMYVFATDGSAPGTRLLGTAPAYPAAPMAVVGDRYYQTAYSSGAVLTASLSNPEQLHTLVGVDAGSGGRAPFAVLGDNAYCVGVANGVRGLIELNAAGTASVVRSAPPATPAADTQPVVAAGTSLLFRAEGFDAALGRWAALRDGASATIDPLVATTAPAAGSDFGPFERVGDEAAFLRTGGTGTQVYFTDGSNARTRSALPDAIVVNASRTPSDRLLTVGNRVLAVTADGTLAATSGDPATAAVITAPITNLGTRPALQAETLLDGRRIIAVNTTSFLTDGTPAGTAAISATGHLAALNQIGGVTYYLDDTGRLAQVSGFPPVLTTLSTFTAFAPVITPSFRYVIASVDGGFIAGRYDGITLALSFIDPITRTSTLLRNVFTSSVVPVQFMTTGGAVYLQVDSTYTYVATRTGARQVPNLSSGNEVRLVSAASGRAIGRFSAFPGVSSAIWGVDVSSTAPLVLLSSPYFGNTTKAPVHVLSRRPVTRALVSRIVYDSGVELYSTDGTLPGTFQVGVMPRELVIDFTSVGDVIGSKYIFTATGRFGREPYIWIPCPADVASLGGDSVADGQLTIDDIVTYLAKFFENSTGIADLTSVGGTGAPDGQLTPDDLIFFLQSFFAGCP